MIYDLKNEYQVVEFKEYVSKLIESKSIVELKKKSPNRSLSQNAYLHLILGYFACEYGCSLDEVKIDFYKRVCNKVIFERTMINKNGKQVVYLRSSAELTTDEMTTSIDRFRNWASAQAGIYLPAPNEDQFLIHIQREIELKKEYL